MAQNQVIWGSADTVKVTFANAASAGDLVNVGKWYGVVNTNVGAGEEGILCIRGVFRLPKANASEEIASGDFIEFVSGGKVRKYSSGVKIGKAYANSAAGEEYVDVILMPELY